MFVGVLASFEEAFAGAISDTYLSFASGASTPARSRVHAPPSTSSSASMGPPGLHSGPSVRQWSEEFPSSTGTLAGLLYL
eukprot:3059817-Alexandrium_andersonii.AAC.1